MERLPSPISIAVLLVAATGLRISEFLALRWRHVLWDESKIFIEQVFRRGTVSQTMLRHAKTYKTSHFVERIVESRRRFKNEANACRRCRTLERR